MVGKAGRGRAPLGCPGAHPVGVTEELAVHNATSRLQDAGHLAPGGVLVGDLPEGRDEHNRIERAVGVGKLLGVSAGRRDVPNSPSVGACASSHRASSAGRRGCEPAIRPDPICQRQRVVAGARPISRIRSPSCGSRSSRSRARVIAGAVARARNAASRGTPRDADATRTSRREATCAQQSREASGARSRRYRYDIPAT